jgi:hypothetical protein
MHACLLYQPSLDLTRVRWTLYHEPFKDSESGLVLLGTCHLVKGPVATWYTSTCSMQNVEACHQWSNMLWIAAAGCRPMKTRNLKYITQEYVFRETNWGLKNNYVYSLMKDHNKSESGRKKKKERKAGVRPPRNPFQEKKFFFFFKKSLLLMKTNKIHFWGKIYQSLMNYIAQGRNNYWINYSAYRKR